MPNPTIVSIQATNTTGTALPALTIPTGGSVVPGDVAYYCVSQTGGQALTILPGTGNIWAQDAAHQAWNGTTNRLTVFVRTLDATDIGDTIGGTFAAAQVSTAVLFIVHNHGGEDGAPVTRLKTTASTTDAFNAITPTGNDRLIVYIDGNNYGTSSATLETHTQPTNYTEDIDSGGPAGTNNKASIAVGHRQLVGGSGVAETVGSITLGVTARQAAMVIAIAPTTIIAKSAATQDSVAVHDQPISGRSPVKATVDSTSPTDRVVSGRSPVKATIDSISPTDRVVSNKSPTKAIVDSVSPADRVVSGRSPTRPTAEVASPADSLVGRKNASAPTREVASPSDQPVKPAPPSASGATRDQASPTDTPIGSKQGTRTTADSTGVGEVVPGRHGAARATADTASPTDTVPGRKTGVSTTADATTPVGVTAARKAASGSVADSIAPTGRPTGAKARSGATATSAAPADRPSKGFVVLRPTVDVASPQDVPAGRKDARGGTSTSAAPVGRPQGSRAALRAAQDATPPTGRPAGRKTAITIGVDFTLPRTVSVGRKTTARPTVDLSSPIAQPVVFRGAFGSTRSSTSLDEVIVRTLIYRDITVVGGRLRRDRLAGLVRPRIAGKLKRRPTGTAGGTAPEGDLREHS